MRKRIIYQGIYIVLNATGEEGLKINELCIQENEKQQQI